MLFENNKGFCPWCKTGSAFVVEHEQADAAPFFAWGGSPSGSPNRGQHRAGVIFFKCQHCEKAVIVLEHELPPVEGVHDQAIIMRSMVYPPQQPRTVDEAVPESVRSLFEEASRCEKAEAMRGAGVLYRAAVEDLVKDQGATGRTLYDKIDSLKGRLPDDLITDLHEARMLGNDSIHDGLTYSAEEVADVAELIVEAALVLYVQPEQKRAMREARKKRREGV